MFLRQKALINLSENILPKRNYRLEPENHPFWKGQSSSNLHFGVLKPLVFGGVDRKKQLFSGILTYSWYSLTERNLFAMPSKKGVTFIHHNWALYFQSPWDFWWVSGVEIPIDDASVTCNEWSHVPLHKLRVESLESFEFWIDTWRKSPEIHILQHPQQTVFPDCSRLSKKKHLQQVKTSSCKLPRVVHGDPGFLCFFCVVSRQQRWWTAAFWRFYWLLVSLSQGWHDSPERCFPSVQS